MKLGRGGACVPARVALQGRIHRSIPRTQCVYFWYGNAAVRTFGRAHRYRPYGFVWVDYAWTVGFVWVDYTWMVGGVWVDCIWTVGIVPALFRPYASTHSPFYAFYFCSVYFFNG